MSGDSPNKTPRYSPHMDEFFTDEFPSEMMLDFETDDEIEPEPTKAARDEDSEELFFEDRYTEVIDEVDGAEDVKEKGHGFSGGSSGDNGGVSLSDYKGRPLPSFPPLYSGSLPSSRSTTISTSTASLSSRSSFLMDVDDDNDDMWPGRAENEKSTKTEDDRRDGASSAAIPAAGYIYEGIRLIKSDTKKRKNEESADTKKRKNEDSDSDIQFVGSYDKKGYSAATPDVEIIGYGQPRRVRQASSDVQIICSYDSEGFKFEPSGGNGGQSSGGRMVSSPVAKKAGPRGPKKGCGGRPPLTNRTMSRRPVPALKDMAKQSVRKTNPKFETMAPSSPPYVPTPQFNSAIPPPSSGFGIRGNFHRGRGTGRSFNTADGNSSSGCSVSSAGAFGSPLAHSGYYISKYVNKRPKLVSIVLNCDQFQEYKEKRIKNRVDFRSGVDSYIQRSDGSGLAFITKAVTEDSAQEEMQILNTLKFDGADVVASRLEDEDPAKIPAVVKNSK